MVDFKLVIGAKDGKCYQKEVKDDHADNLLKRIIGDKISGDLLGMDGYEFEITGGSDKCGFPMRKGIQIHRKRVKIGEGVGFIGKKRPLRKKSKPSAQEGILKRRTVCGERVTKIIRQINLKVLKEGSAPLGEAPAPAEAPAEGTEQAAPEAKEAPAEDKKE